MPITIRTTAPDITTNSTYNTYKANLDCVSILTYQADLVTAWDSSGITVSQTELNKLDNSYEEIGNQNKSLILRPGISMNTQCSLNTTYDAYKTMTEAMGVYWIIGYVSGDPQSGGTLIDFPYQDDPQMRVLTEHVYQFLRTYLTATSTTTTNGVTFGGCPCTNIGYAHSRKMHTLEVNCIKPGFQFHEMTGGVGGDAATNAPLFHAAEIACFGAGDGATFTTANKAIRAQRTVEEWDWALSMVWAKLGDVCRTSIATGAIFQNYTVVNNILASWGATYPPGWLTCFRTNLKASYYDLTGGSEKDHLRQVYLAGLTVAMQTAGTAPAGSAWGQDQVDATEHMLSGVEADGVPNGGYGTIEFIELQGSRLGGATFASTAVGDWAGGSVNGLQYYLTHVNSVNSRLATFTPWATDTPPVSGTPITMGAYTV